MEKLRINSSDISNVESEMVYGVDKALTQITPISIAYGNHRSLSNGELAILTPDKTLYVYDSSLTQIHRLEPVDGMNKHLNDYDLGSYAGKYYLFSYRFSTLSPRDCIAELINYSDNSIIPVYIPYDYIVRQDYFPEITQNFPRFNSNRVEFENDHFNLIFELTTYEGEKKEAIYKYDLSGEQIYPQPAPPYIYLAASHLTGFEPVHPGEDDKQYILYYPYGGKMEGCALIRKYHREFSVEFNVECTDPTVLSLFKIESSMDNGVAYQVKTLKEGTTELVFSVADYGEIDRWKITVKPHNH